MSSIVGIDLGDSGATVATIKKGAIDVVLNESSKRKSPALVSFANGQRYLGEPAASLESSNAKNTVREFKRLVGKAWSDPELQRDLQKMPNKDRFKQGLNDSVIVEVDHAGKAVQFDMTAMLAMQLGGLKRTSERTMKESSGQVAIVRDVVLSVPSYYTDAQRHAVLDAGQISGLNVLSLCNDSVAVALDYGMWKNARNQFDETKRTLVMFIDVGYSDTWVSIVSYTKGKLSQLSCQWDRELGGREVDSALMEQFAAEFQAKTKLDCRMEVKSMIKLRSAAEKAKQILTPEGVSKAEVFVEYLMNETDFRSALTVDQLDAVVKPLAERIIPVINRALEDAGVKAADMSAVEMIGGSSRMRQFKRAVGTIMGLDTSKAPNHGVLTTLNADETVARGVALMCAMMSPQLKIATKLSVEELVPLPIRVEWEVTPAAAAPAIATNGDVDMKDEEEIATTVGTNKVVLLNRKDTTPRVRRVTFRRNETFDVVAAYDDPPEYLLGQKAKREIGRYRISGMPANAAGKGKISVDFEHDKNGVFGVKVAQFLVTETDAADAGKKKVTKTDLHVQSFRSGHSEQELEKLTLLETELSSNDKALKDRADKRNELEEYVYTARGDVVDGGSLTQFATEQEREALKKKLEEDEAWMYEEEGEAATIVQLNARLTGLQRMYGAVQSRLLEIEARTSAASKLSNAIDSYLNIVNSTSTDYIHLADEEKNKVRAACSEAMQWLTTQQEVQGKLPLNKDPVLSAAQIDERAQKLRTTCVPIVHKSKPKAPKSDPPPAQSPSPDAGTTPTPDNAASSEENQDVKMDEEKPVEEKKTDGVEELD